VGGQQTGSCIIEEPGTRIIEPGTRIIEQRQQNQEKRF